MSLITHFTSLESRARQSGLEKEVLPHEEKLFGVHQGPEEIFVELLGVAAFFQ